MPASSARSTGSVNAVVLTTDTPMPSALAEIAVLRALTISPFTDFSEPVHWYEQPSSAHASAMPYRVGTKNGLVVTWLTNTNRHLGVDGKSPLPPLEELSLLHAASSAVAAAAALVSPAPVSNRRRDVAGSGTVSRASSTAGWTVVIAGTPSRSRTGRWSTSGTAGQAAARWTGSWARW